MKKLFIFALGLLTLASCTKQEPTTHAKEQKSHCHKTANCCHRIKELSLYGQSLCA